MSNPNFIAKDGITQLHDQKKEGGSIHQHDITTEGPGKKNKATST